MGKAIHSRTIGEICGKPKADVIEQVRRVLEQIRKDMEAREEQEKKSPRLNFIAAAQEAGFSESQAEFLWVNRPRPK